MDAPWKGNEHIARGKA